MSKFAKQQQKTAASENAAMSRVLSDFALTSQDDPGLFVMRSGRTMVKVRHANAEAMAVAFDFVPKITPARISEGKRYYPTFKPGMSTDQYVKEYFSLNDGVHFVGDSDEFFQKMNCLPCTLYEGGATDYEVKEEPIEATQEEPEWSKKWQSDMEEALREIEAMKAQREQSKPAAIHAPAEPIHAPAVIDPALSEALNGLAMYGADLNSYGFVRRGEKTLSVRIAENKGRYRYMGNGGNILATSPATADGVCKFVESFWFWEKTESTQELPPVDVIGGALANGGHVVGDSLRTANGQHLKTLTPTELTSIPAEKITPVAEHVARVNAYIAAHSAPAEPESIETSAHVEPLKTIPGDPWDGKTGERSNWIGIGVCEIDPTGFYSDLMACVNQAKNEGLFYNSDTWPRCADLMASMGYDDASESNQDNGVTRVFGSHCYLAGDAIRNIAARIFEAESMARLAPFVKQELGTLVFTDYKRTTGVCVTEVDSMGGISISGKRGKNTVTARATAAQLRHAIDRAFERKQRKDSFDTAHPEKQAAQKAHAEPVPVDCADAQVDAYIQAIADQEVGALSEAIAAIEQVQGVATAELATVCAADPAQAVGSVGIGAAIPADSTPAQKTTERNPQADHLAARADVAQRHAEQADEAPEVGGGEGRPFENEISPSAFLGDVPLSLAVQAHSGTSFTPEKRGASVQTSYAHVMAQDYKEMHAQAVRGGTLDLLPEVFSRYRARQASAYRAYLASSSRIVSSFIAGPSNFPAARMNKRADIAHRRLTEYLDGGEMAKRAAIRTLRPDLRAIMSGDADAVDRLTVKINAAERSQAAMKEANKAIRQHAKAGEAAQLEALMSLGFTESMALELLRPRWGNSQGFASYSLSNNNANIRRMRERLEQITKAQACEVVEIEGANGIRLEDDAPANRVRLFFPGKPAAEIRETLKARGFRWAPSVGAWQAYRNNWTLKTAQEIAGKPSEREPVDAQQVPQEVPPEIPAEIAPEVAQMEPVDAPAPAQAAPIEPAAPTPCEPVENTASEAPALPEVAAEPSDNTPPKNGTGFAQQASSKVGAWVAALYRDTQGAHVLRFDMAGMAPVFHSFKTRGTMLASLQALGSAADRGHLAHFLSGFSVLDSSGAEVRSMAPAIFQALRDHLEDINYHTEALMVSCFRADRDDLAAGVAHLVRFQAAPGYEGLPSDMAEARAAVSRVLRGEAPGPISPEAAARLAEWGLSFDPAPTLPAPQQADTPPGVGGAAHPILESAPAFTKVAPFSLDPCTILQAGVTAEQLVGLGVVYLGNAANASGEGAITSATASREFGDVQMVCTLEDGRVINASRYSFTGEVRPIFQFNGKMHGAPYLAQLSAVRAAIKAQHSSAQAIKETEHARQLEALAAEFPQLERPGKNSAGKLAAINIRKLLKQAFKAVKFSVTSDYNSARVSWEDGPTVEQVNAVIGRFHIGHSDCNSDYFYTTETAWSQLFGGVQYLTTSRSTSDTLVSSAIAQAFSGASLPEDATPKAWRNASGAFSWNTDGGQMYSRRVREILSKTPA